MVRKSADGEKQIIPVSPKFNQDDVKNIYSMWKFFLCSYGIIPLDEVNPTSFGDSMDATLREVKALREDFHNQKDCDFFMEVVRPLLQQWAFCFNQYYSTSRRVSTLEGQVDKCVLNEQKVLEDQDAILFEISQRIRNHGQEGSSFYRLAYVGLKD